MVCSRYYYHHRIGSVSSIEFRSQAGDSIMQLYLLVVDSNALVKTEVHPVSRLNAAEVLA